MKKISLKVSVFLLACCLMSSSCIGSYSLFNNYAKWQANMTDNKFVNAVVGFVLGIVCIPVTLVVDSLVLNTIEFWSGENPMADIGKTKQVLGEDGVMYAVKTLKNGYEITDPKGEITLITHDKKTDSWSVSKNGVTQEIFRFNPDGKSISTVINGEEKNFSLNEQGVFEARMLAGEGLFFAAR